MNKGTTGTKADAIELLVSQHREVEQLWSQLQTAERDRAEVRHDLARRIVEDLSRHDAIETQLLYPAVRKVPGGDQLADHSLDEHQRVREMLKDVDGEDPADPKVFARFSECVQAVLQHVEEEEHQIFPKLREVLGQEELSELGGKMEIAWAVAPTHPHPSTPNNPIGAAVAGTVAGVVDRARDAMKK
jgi:hemerythrin superfamily protein